jgi:hypothetical protein
MTWEPEMYAQDEEESDFAYYEEDTWNWWKFWLPVGVILIVACAGWYVENWYTRPPKIDTAPKSEWALRLISMSYFTGKIDSVITKPYPADKIEIHNDYLIFTKKPCSGGHRVLLSVDMSDDRWDGKLPLTMEKFDKQWSNICFSSDEEGRNRLDFKHETGTYWVDFGILYLAGSFR